MAEAELCPICKQSVQLTVFGIITKHGNKAACRATGYTLKEAAAMVVYSSVSK